MRKLTYLGSLLVGAVFATTASLPLHAEIFNPAQRLYERLGFSKIGMDGIYFKMEWRPEIGVPEISTPSSQTMDKSNARTAQQIDVF